MTYLDKATALLDIHSSMTPGSIPFVICENNGVGIASYLPGDLIVTGFDTVSPGGTDEYMNRHNRIGICIECGQHLDPHASTVAVSAIHAFLARRGHTMRTFPQIHKQRIKVFEMYRTKTDVFEHLYRWNDFAAVPKGAIIGIDGTEEIRAPKDSFILFARDRSQVGTEAFLLAESVI